MNDEKHQRGDRVNGEVVAVRGDTYEVRLGGGRTLMATLSPRLGRLRVERGHHVCVGQDHVSGQWVIIFRYPPNGHATQHVERGESSVTREDLIARGLLRPHDGAKRDA